MMTDVEVQTGISVRPDTDLVTLLERAMQLNSDPIRPAAVEEDCAPAQVKPTTDAAGLHSCGGGLLLLTEGTANHIGKAYPHSSLFLCLACQQAHSINRYRRRSLFVETLDPIHDVPGNSSDECATYHLSQEPVFHVAAPAAEEPLTEEEEAALNLGLPLSWATESSAYCRQQTHSSSPPLSPRPSSCSGRTRLQPERGAATADLSAHFDRADITPIKNISMSLSSPPPAPPSRSFLPAFNPISPVAAGRTSPEARAFRLQQSMSLTYEEDFQSALEESFRTSPCRQQQRPMASPELSPILPCSPDSGSPPRLLLLSPCQRACDSAADFRHSVMMDES